MSPEFGNLPGYDFQARLGEKMKFIPWSGELSDRLREKWEENFVNHLPPSGTRAATGQKPYGMNIWMR